MIYWKIKKGWTIAPWYELFKCYMDVRIALSNQWRNEVRSFFGTTVEEYLERLESNDE